MINGKIYSKKNEDRQVFILGILGNLALAILQLCVGLFGYSKLVLISGIFSFTNAVILLLMWQGDILEKKEANERYPYGYGKAIFLTMSVAGLVVLIIAIYMFFYGLTRIAWVEIHRSHSGAFMVTVISIIGNELLYRYLMDKGKRQNNGVILWNVLNNRIHVLTLILILFFIFFASLGAAYVEKIGICLISIIMFFMSLRILFMAFAGIMDKIPPQKVLNQIKSYARKIKGIKEVLDIKARYVGTLLHLDLSIAVDEGLNMKDADRIARDFEDRLIQKAPFIKEVNVSIT